jgi:hypothetical protein
MLSENGFAETLKSGGGGCGVTVNDTVRLLVKPLRFPVIVSVRVPSGESEAMFTVSVLATEPLEGGVTDPGLNAQVTPGG